MNLKWWVSSWKHLDSIGFLCEDNKKQLKKMEEKMNGEEKLRKSINFAVKNPIYVDFSMTLLDVKRTIKAYEEATLKKDWDLAYSLSIELVDWSQRLEDIAQQMAHDEK